MDEHRRVALIVAVDSYEHHELNQLAAASADADALADVLGRPDLGGFEVRVVRNETAAVVLGDVEAYVHTGGQYEWDSAAPVAVARAAGLHTSRVDGTPLRYNQADVKLPDLVVCRPELADEILAVLAELLPHTDGVTP